MHTNYNSVWLINIDLIILKVIPQPAHYLKWLFVFFNSLCLPFTYQCIVNIYSMIHY